MPWQDDPVITPTPRRSASWQSDPVVGADEQPAPKRSYLRQLGRDAAFAGGQLYEGATSWAALPLDAMAGAYNAGVRTFFPEGHDVTINGQKVHRTGEIPTASEASHRDLVAMGVPQAETRADEIAGSVYRGIGGAATSLGVGGLLAQSARPVTAGVGSVLVANPAIQGTSAVTGALGSEAAKEMGGGPIAQLVSGVAGAAAPSALATAPQAAVRGGFRGGEQGRQRVHDNLQTFRTAGTTPSVGQASESRVARAAESALARTPGAAGRMASSAEGQAEDVGAALERQAQALAGRGTSAEQTGRHIERAVRGEGGFVERFKEQQGALYDKLDQFVPGGTRVEVARTKEALQALNAEIPGAPNVSRYFQNARIKGIEGALKADTEGFGSVAANPENAALFAGRKVSPEDAKLLGDVMADGLLPYEALKKLRTLVGNEIADAGIASDVPRSKWNALYAALSDDLGAAVADNPAARAAWTRANSYTRAGMRRIEAIESVINRNGGPEGIFQAATSGTREGASTLRSVMQSVDEEGQRMITATVLRRLGRAKAGVQGELGDRFSSETFLTNWNGLSTEAKRTLFNRYGDRFRADMDQIAKFAANLRQGSQVFRNPSGTAQATAQVSAATAFVGSLALGRIDAAAAVAGGVAGANLSARLMTNPRFVKWLAQSTKVPQGGYAAMVSRLTQEARGSGDLDLARAAVLLAEQQPQDSSNNTEREQQN